MNNLSPDKAKEIMRDGTAQGHALTPKQKRFMGWVAGGRKRRPKVISTADFGKYARRDGEDIHA